jgi:large conductance mechanosensitive channel
MQKKGIGCKMYQVRKEGTVWKELRAFIMRGNMVDMAVGIIIGAAFGAIVASLVKDVIMPPIGYITGGVDFTSLFVVLKQGTTPPPYPSLADAQSAGAVTINYGVFINSIIVFIIVAVVLFFLIRSVNRMRAQMETPKAVVPAEPATKECPYCLSKIPLKAKKCAHCTSELPK